MAAIVFPKQRQRWGNESTNFFGSPESVDPGHGVPVPQRVYRCEGSQYTNCGNLHNGTKMLNNFTRQDSYGTPSAYHLRAEDQRLPKPLATNDIHQRQLKRDVVDPYQSHVQAQPGYCMPSATSPGGGAGGRSSAHDEAVIQSLHKAFYTTTYDREISRPSSGQSVISDSGSLTSRLLQRRHSAQMDHSSSVHVGRAPVRTLRANLMSSKDHHGVALPRRRALSLNSSTQLPFPSRTEMIKEINSMYPAPQPPPVSVWAGRPSSAASVNRIKGLRL